MIADPTLGYRCVALQLFVRSLTLALAGQERYFSITKAYFRGAQGYIIVFDVGNPETYYNIPKWLQKIDGA